MLRLPPFRYLAPRSLEEAAQMLAQEGEQAMLVAGGTDLFPNMKRRQFTPPVVIGLRNIAALKGISGSPEQGFRIDAGLTLTQLSEHAVLARLGAICSSIRAAITTIRGSSGGTLSGTA